MTNGSSVKIKWKSILFLYFLELLIRHPIVDSVDSSNIMGIYCYCSDCPENENEITDSCLLKPGGQCFSAIEEIYNKETKTFDFVRSFGCISINEQALLQCKGDLVPSYHSRSIKCCNYTDYCNLNLLSQFKPRSTSTLPETFLEKHLYLIIALEILFISSIIVFLAYIFLHFKHKKQNSAGNYLIKAYNVKLQKSQNIFTSSGSGAGKPLLVQTSIGYQFKREHCLGKGQFTEVYVGEWNSSKIVEKVFCTRSEDRWANEKQIYETALLRHDNILGHIAFDILKSGLRTIYIDYHKLGSLCSYLDNVCLSPVEFLVLAKSAADGLAHLHTEIMGAEKRPAVAHRDINSKNFLINSTKHCVLANFEIAVQHISTDENIKEPPNLTLGTPRYMAPEIVAKTINIQSFEGFKKADIYSLGLVFYEMCQRCATIANENFVIEDHSLPFSNVLPSYPNIDDMKMLHSMKKSKEDLLFIPTRWENDEITLKPFIIIMRECLFDNPQSRTTALRIRKSIEILLQKHTA